MEPDGLTGLDSILDWPRHERCVEVEVALVLGQAEAVIIGSDLSHEYVAINSDYRS